MPASLGVIGCRGKAAFAGVKNLVFGGITNALSFGAYKETNDGNPAAPCLGLKFPSVFQFRWAVLSGTRTISVNVKQAANTAPHPSLVVKANSDIGVNSDASASSAGGAGWVTIGPVTINPTSAGVVYVELRNNLLKENASLCFFDHIVTS